MIIKTLARFVVDDIQRNGGTTINRAGKRAKKGFALSLHKERERIIDGGWLDRRTATDAIIEYINDNLDLLKHNHNYIGVWIDAGQLFLDIASVVKNKKYALVMAKKNNQKAIFDLAKKETIFIK